MLVMLVMHAVLGSQHGLVHRYQITIATLLLCDNPAYVEKEQPTAGITCKALYAACWRRSTNWHQPATILRVLPYNLPLICRVPSS